MNNRLVKEIDKYLAIFGIIIGFIAIFLSLRYHLNREYLGVAIITGSSLYIVCRNLLKRRQVKVYRFPRWSIWVTFILFMFFIFFSETVVRNSLYYRSAGYILLIMGAVIICLLQVELFVDQANLSWMITAILLEICVLGLSVKSSAFFMYPDVSGNDPFFHQRVIQEIVTQGIIPVTSYQSLPLMHLISASFMFLTDLSSKFGLFYISILQSLVYLGLYFLGKGISDSKTGLIAVILFSLSDYSIQWGVQIIPMTVGTILFTLILISVFQRAYSRDEKDKTSWTVVIIILGASLIVAHSLSSLIVLVVLATIALATSIYNLFIKTKDWVQWSLTILLCIGLFTYWMYAFSSPGLDFFSMVVKSFNSAIATAEVGDVSRVSLAQELNYTSVLLSEMGWSLLLVITIAGALESITKRIRQPSGRLIAAITGVLLIVTYGGAIIGAGAILPARWIVFLYVPAAVLGASYLTKMIASSTNMLRISGLLFVVVISFFMITQPGRAMPDSPLYAPEFGFRLGFYSSEIQGLDFVLHHFDSSCKVVASSKSDLYLYQAGQLDPRKPNTYQKANIIVLRSFDEINGVFIPFEPGKIYYYAPITPEFVSYLLQPQILRSYDDGSVKIFATSDCALK
jgi:hypothetical protein